MDKTIKLLMLGAGCLLFAGLCTMCMPAKACGYVSPDVVTVNCMGCK